VVFNGESSTGIAFARKVVSDLQNSQSTFSDYIWSNHDLGL